MIVASHHLQQHEQQDQPVPPESLRSTSKYKLDKPFFVRSFKETSEEVLEESKRKPEQQQTPKASPIMEKASTVEDKQNLKQQQQQQIQNLLGPQFASWPYTETSLIHAINLKSEQEKTKQEYYKLETLNRSLELLKHSILARVPANLIPLIFAGQNMSQENVELIIKNNQTTAQPEREHAYHQSMSTFQQQQPFQVPPLPNRHQQATTTPRQLHESNPFRSSHERSQTISTPKEYHQRTSNDEFGTPPMPTGFRFGGDKTDDVLTPSSVQLNPPIPLPIAQTPPRCNTFNRGMNMMMSRPRQLSPAKLGAQAVASLNNKFKSNPLRQNHHNRTISLPPQVSIPEASTVAFHEREETTKKKSPALPTVNTPTPSKPVILQHQLIQFHHWTPNDNSIETTPNKRRRSSETIDEKAINELKDDNMHERRKFITTHARTRSDTSLMQQQRNQHSRKQSLNGDEDEISSKDNDKSSPPKYPNILSN